MIIPAVMFHLTVSPHQRYSSPGSVRARIISAEEKNVIVSPKSVMVSGNTADTGPVPPASLRRERVFGTVSLAESPESWQEYIVRTQDRYGVWIRIEVF